MTTPVLRLSHTIFITSGLLVVIAVFCSWYASIRLYRPVLRLVDSLGVSRESEDLQRDEFMYIEQKWRHLSRESQVLQVQLERQLPGLRKGFLLQLVQGHLYALSECELLERMNQYGWELQRNQQFVVMIVQLSGPFDGSGKFMAGDEQLITFSAGNIAEELSRITWDQVDIINFEDMAFGMLLVEPGQSEEAESKAKLLQFAGNLTQALNGTLQLDVTVSISQRTDQVRSLPEWFEKARRTLSYRDVNLRSQVLDAESLMPRGSQDVLYPLEQDRLIIQAIRIGDSNAAFTHIQQFVSVLQLSVGKEHRIRQAVAQLLGNIQYAILQSGFDPYDIYGEVPLIDQCNMVQPERLVKWLCTKVIEPYFEAMSQTSNIQSKQLVEKAFVILGDCYMEDLSLESIAETLGTYPQKLSTAFKKVAGITFIDYITMLRLEKSKEMLTTTDYKISDIAERVGYQPSYYNRLFKKRLGITPGQYREDHSTTERDLI